MLLIMYCSLLRFSLCHSLPILLHRSFSPCHALCPYFCAVLSLCVALCQYFCVILCQYFCAMSFSKVSKDLANKLILVPRPHAANKSQKQMILTVLDLSDVTRAIMEQHISIVRPDKHLFQHTIDDQSNTLIHFCCIFAKICE